MNGNTAILGAQWGDEGKGKIVDLLCDQFDVVARFQGGHNAGHTVKFADKHYSLHLIPSGILHPGKLCVLGNGMVIDPKALMAEMEHLESLGVDFGDRLKISDSAQCILPWHTALDLAREASRGEEKIGTTGRGIGPAYETKASRHGVLVGDLLRPTVLRNKLQEIATEKNALIHGLYGGEPIDPAAVEEEYLAFGEKIARRITNTSALVNEEIAAGRRVMFEGAQGTLLDVDHGTYPYVTSSNCVAGGICTGLGVPPRAIDSILGVVKAYSTRVGGGPFPTELRDATGDRIRERGNEFGTTTGRPRRCGWLDLVALRTSVVINGLDEIALTKLDVLDQFDEIPVCTEYRIGGETTRLFSPASALHETIEPGLVTLKGWQSSIVGMQSFDDLPQTARDYIRFIESEIECRISIVSTGPRREETIVRQ